jgi:ParB family chromosome partitioning protein
MPKKKFDPTIKSSMNSAAADSFLDNVKTIDVDELHESDNNFFDVNRIEEFAETIYEQGGIMETLIVTPHSDGGYEVISGHRRTAAVRELLKSGKRVSRVLPCLIRNYADEDEKRLDIILMNISSRIISDSEMWKCYEIINEVLQNKKKLGEKFGQVQKTLAKTLGISTGQTAKMQSIDKRATPEVKEALENGDISINTAEKIAKLAENQQKEVLEKSPDKSKIKPKDIEKVITDGISDYTDDDSENSEDSAVSEDVEESPPDNLFDYMHRYSSEICAIFNTYLGITDNEREREVIAEIKRFIQ